MKRLAAIDIGSNSLLLSIVDTERKDLSLIVDECRVTGLAKGVKSGAAISPESLDKSCSALKEYAQLIHKFKPEVVKAVATEGLRRLGNSEAAKYELEKALEHPIELISGIREAELSFWSVQKAHPELSREKIVFDIGGASTELILGNHLGIQKKCSLKLGSVVLSDLFRLQEPSNGEEAMAQVKEILDASEFSDIKTPTLGVGVAGTMTTLIAVWKQITQYDRDLVHLQKISQIDLAEWRSKILSLPLEGRKGIPGLPFDRADVFGGGLTIALALAEHFNWSNVTCMDSGIRFGLLYEMMDAL